jgi:SAM-dependent methyltransferase
VTVGNIMNVYDHIGGEFDKYRSEIGLCDVLALIDEMGRDIHVLDLGCGTGHPIAVRIAPMVSRYLGVDNSAPMLDAFKQNAPAVECRLLDMALVARVGGCWDLIFSYGAICHLSRDGQVAALTAISGLLKSGGRLLFTGAEQEGHCTGSVGPYVDVIDHYSLGRAGYAALLEKSGMRQLWAEARDGGNFTYLYEKGANQVPEDTARKLADPQR